MHVDGKKIVYRGDCVYMNDLISVIVPIYGVEDYLENGDIFYMAVLVDLVNRQRRFFWHIVKL